MQVLGGGYGYTPAVEIEPQPEETILADSSSKTVADEPLPTQRRWIPLETQLTPRSPVQVRICFLKEFPSFVKGRDTPEAGVFRVTTCRFVADKMKGTSDLAVA